MYYVYAAELLSILYICVFNYFCNCDIYKVIAINNSSNKYIKQSMKIIMHVYSREQKVPICLFWLLQLSKRKL